MAPSSSKFQVAREQRAEQVDLIDVLNVLQNKISASGHILNISLPQIAVIGGQSAGKSSVLERFVGRQFLPRGEKLVTRRPINVQLIPSNEEYGVFEHKKDTKFRDFNAIREEILRATDEECPEKGFSSKPIFLTIYSPRVLKLTVIDLPGIIRVPVEGQTKDDCETVRNIVLDHIRPENILILAVTPKCQDLSGSDALEIAQIVDPQRERTIGVMTKLDVGSEDARVILDNKHLTLKRGWVAVVNGSHDAADGEDMAYIAKQERDFFLNSPLYSYIADRSGITYLQKLLQKMLREHIKNYLPGLRMEITNKLTRTNEEIEEIKQKYGNGPLSYMIRNIQDFIQDIEASLMGYSEKVTTNSLTHGAIIQFKLQIEALKIQKQVLLPNKEEVIKLICNINGMRHAISVPSLAVDCVCRTLIERFKEPLDSIVDCVKGHFIEAVEKSATLIDKSPSLKRELVFQINQWIETESVNTKKQLLGLIGAEINFINTGHPNFDSSTCDPISPPTKPLNVWKDFDEKKGSNTNEFLELLMKNESLQKQVEYVAAICVKYLEIIQIQVSDIAIKFIAFFLVKKVLDAIQQDLIQKMIAISDIASEDCNNEIRRQENLSNTCNVFTDALDAINSFLGGN